MVNPRMDQLRFCLVVSTTGTCGLLQIISVDNEVASHWSDRKAREIAEISQLKLDVCVNWWASSILK